MYSSQLRHETYGSFVKGITTYFLFEAWGLGESSSNGKFTIIMISQGDSVLKCQAMSYGVIMGLGVAGLFALGP